MGAKIDLPEGEHKLLVERIEDILGGRQSLLPYPEPVERLAQLYASQLVRRLSDSSEPSTDTQSAKTEPDFIAIDVNSIEKLEPRTVGVEHLLLQMANQLQMSEKLKELGLSATKASTALGSIIARAAFPDSERSTYYWLCNNSGIVRF